MLARCFHALALSLAVGVSAASADALAPRVEMQTSQGEIILELDARKAPVTVANFLAYVDSGYFDGTIFHRVIPGFMIQGGGFTPAFERRSGNAPIENEADNGLKNTRGTIAMARTQDPHSATSQFFINTVDNPALDHRQPQGQGWGYAVFGKVIDGMDTVDRISAVSTGQHGYHQNVPKQAIIIERVTRVDGG